MIDENHQELEKRLAYLKLLKEQLDEAESGLTDEDRRVREECENSLATFIKYMWKSIDTSTYKHNWHIDAIAEHLESMIWGDIKHLLINVSPRCMKSILGSVSLTPWVWAQQEKTYRSGPETSFLYASYGQKLSFEHSLKTRMLINSPLYQKLWGKRFQLLKDQNTITKFTNNLGGYRMATSVGGTLTGSGAAIIGVDDPHNTVEMESEDIVQGVIDWWDTALSTRLNDPVQGSFFVIMQRLRENDLSGHILDQNGGEWTHLCIPMEMDLQRHCTTSIGFSDPRTEEDELMWPDRIDRKALDALKKKLGPFGASGQLQQSPSPKGGGIIKESYWGVLDDAYDGAFPDLEFIIGSCDTAYTEDQENDYSAMTVWGVYRDFRDEPKIVLMYAWQERLGLHDLVVKIAATAKRFKIDRLVIEAKASGISVSQEIRRLFSNEVFGIQMINPKGDKVARMMSVEPIFAEGLINVPQKKDILSGKLFVPDWADLTINQVSQFPKGRWKDIPDTVSMGIKFLRDTGLAVRRDEHDLYKQEQTQHKGKKEILYDV